eukprot:s2598_g4.t1
MVTVLPVPCDLLKDAAQAQVVAWDERFHVAAEVDAVVNAKAQSSAFGARDATGVEAVKDVMPTERSTFERLVREAPSSDGAVEVLDFGCGDGRYLRQFLRSAEALAESGRALRIVAYEVSAEALRSFHIQAQREGLAVVESRSQDSDAHLPSLEGRNLQLEAESQKKGWKEAPWCWQRLLMLLAPRVEDAEVHEATEQVLHEGGGMLIFAAASLMLALLIGNFLHHFEVSVLSESMVIIIIGYLLGIILPTHGGSVIAWAIGDVGVEEEGLAMAGVLNLFLLPIIIFEAGWSMNHRAFVDLLFTILTFAVGGTLISMVVVGFLINATCHVRTAFTYAALISAVDPVATLATYAHLQVDPLLNICVFGIASQTSLLLFGSVGLGVALGFVLMLITRMSRLTHSTSNCVLFMFLSSFFIYSFAERACGMSGIITVLFGAMFASAFAKYQFSGEVNMFCAFTLKQAANLADMATWRGATRVVFLMVGITAVYCDVQGLVFGLLVCAFCLVGRAAAVIPLAFLTNLFKEIYRRDLPQEKKMTLDWRKIFMMWHAGLRGGIALVLTLELGPWVDQEQAGTKNTLRNATVLVIVFFLIPLSYSGGSTKVLLKCLDIPMEGTAPPMAIHHGKFWRSMHLVRDGVLKRLLMLRGDEKESSTLPQILADFAEVERRTTSSASLPDAPPVSHVSIRGPGPSRRGSDLLERCNPTERRRQGGQFVSLFGVQDPMHVDDDTSSEEDEDDSDESAAC